jgi:transposase-like protein
MPDVKPLGQQYHDAVEELKSQGMKNSDAIREVAARFQKQPNAIRVGIHQWRSRHGLPTSSTGRGRSARQASRTVDSLVGEARKALEDALSLIDREVADAKVALDRAQSHYDEVVAGVSEKKQDIEAKLGALK